MIQRKREPHQIGVSEVYHWTVNQQLAGQCGPESSKEIRASVEFPSGRIAYIVRQDGETLAEHSVIWEAVKQYNSLP